MPMFLFFENNPHSKNAIYEIANTVLQSATETSENLWFSDVFRG